MEINGCKDHGEGVRLKELRFAIITVSDRSSRGERPDSSGPALVDFIKSKGGMIKSQSIIPDDLERIKIELIMLSDDPDIDIILTTGGTGVSPRDVTPEATLSITDRLIPGIHEYIRSKSIQITPHAMLSRAIAAIRKQTIIINLPGSPKGAVESLEFVQNILPHAVAQLRGLTSAEDHKPRD
jgi:molybdopterin adenylyltransferase